MPATPKQDGGKRSQPHQEPKVLIPEDVSEFYANSVNVLVTGWDFTLLFGSVGLPASFSVLAGRQDATGEIRVDALVRISPQVAKSFVEVLQRMVNEYEATFGTIPLPPGGRDANK